MHHEQCLCFFEATNEKFNWDLAEDITKGSLIVHNGTPVHPSILK